MIGRFFVLSGRRHAAGTLPSGRTLSSCREASNCVGQDHGDNILAIRILRVSSMRALGIRSSYEGRMVNA